MLKKLFKLGVLACLMAVATTASAQEEYIYPHYGFWSNWSIGASIDFIHQGNHGWKWAEGSNIGATLLIEKELNHVWAFRITGGVPAFFTNEDGDHPFDRYGLAEVGFKFSINNAILGYNPDRKGSIYLLASGGAGIERDESTMGNLCLVAEAGLGFSYKVCDWASLFIEAEADGISYSHLFSENWNYHTDFLCNLGLVFDLGVTSADKELIAQRALLTKERFDALNEENDQLKKEVAEEKANEKKLQGQIDELNNENNRIKRECLARAQRVSDSLNGILDNLKNDQLTYYAMPFSVLFDNDSYTVKGSEMTKIKAICQILKDNPDVNLTLAGFCDHTGSDAYNMKLSQKRAEAVKKIMVKKYGIDADRLTIDAKGKTVSFGDLKYDINRRVSFYRVIE